MDLISCIPTTVISFIVLKRQVMIAKKLPTKTAKKKPLPILIHEFRIVNQNSFVTPKRYKLRITCIGEAKKILLSINILNSCHNNIQKMIATILSLYFLIIRCKCSIRSSYPPLKSCIYVKLALYL